jgi:Glycosyl hydrolase family 63 C-terminal domain
MVLDPERKRLKEAELRHRDWKRWGPYLSERQWGTVREDYSPDGSCWNYLSHEHSRSRAYRWGEDGLLGFTDRGCRICFAVALWNEKDPILKERLYGLTGPEGNHGEDVKELYYYLESSPTHSYAKALYKYPQQVFPYSELLHENQRRGRAGTEYEITDTEAFRNDNYFDVYVEYAKESPNDILIKFTVENRSSSLAPLHLIPTIWFRNTWSWGRSGDGYASVKPRLFLNKDGLIELIEPGLGRFFLACEDFGDSRKNDPTNPAIHALFTENDTNMERLFDFQTNQCYVKDSFHDYIVNGKVEAVNPSHQGTKACFHGRYVLKPKSSLQLNLRLFSENEAPEEQFGRSFSRTFSTRVKENNRFYSSLTPNDLTPDEELVTKQAYAGLLWSKQFYFYSVKDWAEGDPTQPAPAPQRKYIRNSEWSHLFNRDIISMPDKWEYPWYAAWDLAFHMIPYAKIDPEFAKDQLILLLREWYMHPNGQIPAYEFAFSDVNPPVHAWACWRVYKITGAQGQRDHAFLARAFHKLLLNFTWWINQKDLEGNNLFSGGFLGLDNIGVFDRSAPLPNGGRLEQADATAWMAFYCGTMLSIALELASFDLSYSDVASKFFEHFVAISDAINNFGGTGLWDQLDGFYYDQLNTADRTIPLRIRSLVGIMPLIAVEVLDEHIVRKLPGFQKRMEWFLSHRTDLAQHVSYTYSEEHASSLYLLAIPSKERLQRMLNYIFDEQEFLSPYGVRSLSQVHAQHPFVVKIGSQEYRINYSPGESETAMFGGNSNWRGPVWFPINYLLIEALERYHYFYGDTFLVEFPSGSGKKVNLREAALLLSERMTRLFVTDSKGRRPCHGEVTRYAEDPHWRDLVLFHEYFHGETGQGLGASHQTGWTALVTRCLERLATKRQRLKQH